MSMLPYIDEEERESQVLRASVVDAAMKLGPGVTGWMFNNAVAEEDEEEAYDERQISTPGLTSSSSSEDSHFATSQSGHGTPFSHPMISLPSKLTPLSSFEKGYYLNSPFVVVDQGHFPRFPGVPEYPYVPPIDTTDIPRPPGLSSASTVSSLSSNSPAVKKPSKGFKFSSKKPSSRELSPKSSVSESVSSHPRAATPTPPPSSLSDPISRPTTPSSSGRAASPNTPRNAGKLKKIRPTAVWKGKDIAAEPGLGKQGWDFKDPDRPSFFAVDEHRSPEPPRASSALGHADVPKGKKKAKKAVGDKDDGYMSEGTGKSKARAKKEKEKGVPVKRSMTSRLMSKLSTSDLRTPAPSKPIPPVPPLPHPIHDKFSSARNDAVHDQEQPGAAQMQDVKNQLSADLRKVVPAEQDRARAGSPYLNVYRTGEGGSRLDVASVEPSPSSSTSSFALVPDINAAKRRMKETWPEGHVVGSDNEAKLAMLAKLISEPPAIEVHPPTVSSPGPEQVVEAPSSNFVVPSPTTERRPSSAVLRYYDVPLSPKSPNLAARPPPSAALGHRILKPTSQLRVTPTAPEATRSGSAPPTMTTHQVQVRGRQAPFPTKPILPTQGAQLARSTSQTRLTRNPVLAANNPRFLTPQRYDNVQTLPVPGANRDPDVPRSVRSSFSKDLEREEDDGDDRSVYSEGSRASFMDVGKSVEAREKLIRGVGAFKEPRWF